VGIDMVGVWRASGGVVQRSRRTAGVAPDKDFGTPIRLDDAIPSGGVGLAGCALLTIEMAIGHLRRNLQRVTLSRTGRVADRRGRPGAIELTGPRRRDWGCGCRPAWGGGRDNRLPHDHRLDHSLNDNPVGRVGNSTGRMLTNRLDGSLRCRPRSRLERVGRLCAAGGSHRKVATESGRGDQRGSAAPIFCKSIRHAGRLIR
jgi:hypothetical protein